jgi:HD-GYP domain-containing protein (c-di-GMP phosphodiesterase class II)
MSQIIVIADSIEKKYKLQNNNFEMQREIIEFVKAQESIMFSSNIVKVFLNIAQNNEFWKNLKDEFIDTDLKNEIPEYSLELSFEEIHNVTSVLSKIIDSKSRYTRRHSQELSEKAAIMADYYSFEKEEKMKLVIAADMHDIGKLAVPNDILDSPNKLSDEEFEVVKKHSYFTRIALNGIKGFEDITEWASNHHEKLNGRGYPFGKADSDLDFNSRLLCCLDIYEALTEERPYRVGLSHKEAIDILSKMKEDGFVDGNITNDIDKAFGGLLPGENYQENLC